MRRPFHYKIATSFFVVIIFMAKWDTVSAQTASTKDTGVKTIIAHNFSSQDTILTAAIIYNGDTIPFRVLQEVFTRAQMTAEQRAAVEAWTRLRNAVYITYPYAKRAGWVINDINNHLANITDAGERRRYIKTREKELRKEFSEPLTNLSVYQGKVLMKLINRETGNNCYDIIKEYKGGLTARIYQTVAFFFDTSLKQPYDANGEDAVMEKIVKQVERMYGYGS